MSSCPYPKNPRQNLSLDLGLPPAVVNGRERNRLTHSNSICLPLVNRSSSISRNEPVSSDFLLSNHAKVEPKPGVGGKGSCESVMTSDTMLSSQASFNVTTIEATSRISSSSESEEDIEGWLLYNERNSKNWNDQEHEVKRVSWNILY